MERKELSLGGSELFRKQTWPSAVLLLLLLATSLARQLNFFPSKIMTFKVVRDKGENIFRWKIKIMHGPRASGPGVHGSRAKADPTGANWIQHWLSLRPQAFPARSMFTPQISPPSLIGLQPDSCWQLSPPPEKLNELEKFPSINCTKSFAAGGATFLWENQSSSDAKKYHPTLTHTIHLTGILLSYAIFTSRINAKMWDASETVKICIYWWNKGNCSGNVTFFSGIDC